MSLILISFHFYFIISNHFTYSFVSYYIIYFIIIPSIIHVTLLDRSKVKMRRNEIK